MGKVYSARDPALDRLVALKTVAPTLLQSPDALQRFEREARAAASSSTRTSSPSTSSARWRGTHFIAMELVEGMDLGQIMYPPDRTPLDQKVRIVVDICRGLDFAHKQGVVHRDIKPANVRVSRAGRREDPRLRDRPARRLRADLHRPGAGHAELHVAGSSEGRRASTTARTCGRPGSSCSRCSPASGPSRRIPSPASSESRARAAAPRWTRAALPGGVIAGGPARRSTRTPAARYADMADMARLAAERDRGDTSAGAGRSTPRCASAPTSSTTRRHGSGWRRTI